MKQTVACKVKYEENGMKKSIIIRKEDVFYSVIDAVKELANGNWWNIKYSGHDAHDTWCGGYFEIQNGGDIYRSAFYVKKIVLKEN